MDGYVTTMILFLLYGKFGLLFDFHMGQLV